MEVKIGYYSKEDWRRLKQIAKDKENLHETFEEWEIDFYKTFKIMESKGFTALKKIVDVHLFEKHCISYGLEINGETRSEYIQNL